MSILNALLPVFLVIATGWLARTSALIPAEQWLGFERVTYYLFFPAIIVLTLIQADLSPGNVLGIGGALIGAILTVATLVFLSAPLLMRAFSLSGPSFTSVFQGATRWNTFVALALAGNLFGKEGLVLIAIAIAAMIPLLNVLAILILTHFAQAHAPNVRNVLAALGKNPFIWSCALGLALNPVGHWIPHFATSYIDILGRASLGAGLLVVGAGLDLRKLVRPHAAHFASSLFKLVLMPTFACFYAVSFGLSGAALGVVAIASAVPTASASYILARQMGGDAPLMAEIITLQTICSLATLPIALAIMGL